MITADSSAHCALTADGLVRGDKILNSKYYRAFCFICGDAIRVPKRKLRVPNACNFCQPAYQGTPGVSEAIRLWDIETFGEIPKAHRL